MKNNYFFNFLKFRNIGKIVVNISLCYFLINFRDHWIVSSDSFFSKKMMCQRESFWRRGSRELETNKITQKLSVLQYDANNPIEDRYTGVELKNFKGYFISVLDGHGGHQMAEFANERLCRYFDEFYLNYKNEGSLSEEDDLVKKALFSTFEKIEKEFYNIAIDLYKQGDGKSATVGSCVLISIISPKKVYTAQLGDSKAKLYTKNDDGYHRVKLTNTHNSEKKTEQAILYKEFSDHDIVVCKRPNNRVCYVKGRLQPTRVN